MTLNDGRRTGPGARNGPRGGNPPIDLPEAARGPSTHERRMSAEARDLGERDFSPGVLAKGARLAFDHPEFIELHVLPDGAGVRARVVSSDGRRSYAVMSDLDPRVAQGPPHDEAAEISTGGGWSWAICTCPHGSNKGDSRCYHVAAVLVAAVEADRERRYEIDRRRGSRSVNDGDNGDNEGGRSDA